MLSASLRAAKDRGEPLSILIAAEWPIYGRFGYAPASQVASYTLFTRGRGALLTPTGTGSVRQMDPAELGDIAPAVFARARLRRAGQVDRRGEWWPRRLGLDGYRPVNHGKTPNNVVHESEDGPDGVLRWSSTREFEMNGDRGAVVVGDLTAASNEAYRNLWANLAGLDLVGEVTLDRRPVDEPIRWLLADGRALRQTNASDDLWLRLLDVAASLAARRYAVPGDVVLEVIDQAADGFASGRYRLKASGDEVECERTDEDADLEITQRALASIYLGGFRLRELLPSGVAREHRPGALARLDLMFSTPLPPWSATWF